MRSACGSVHMETIDLLMYFLRHWNRDFENFKQKNIGLPQDEVGDCSRVLANFYLHEYDNYISNEAKKLKCQIIRYSDDQVIYAGSEYNARKLLYLASNYLSKINLNINSKKIDCFNSKNKFYDYWSFDIFSNLAEPYLKKKVEEGIKIYLDRTKKGINFRSVSVLRKITNVLAKSELKIDVRLKKEIEAQITKDEFILSSRDYDLNNIYKILDQISKK